VFVSLGFTALLLAGIFMRFGRGGEFKGKSVGLASFRAFLSDPAFWIIVVLFCLGISGTLGIYTMLPLYLVTSHGMDRNWANTLLSLSRVAGVFMTLVGGWTTDF